MQDFAKTIASTFVFVATLAVGAPTQAQEVPHFEKICRQLFMEIGDGYRQTVHENINTFSSKEPAFAKWSQMTVNSNSQFHWLIRRSNSMPDPTIEHIKKGIRLRSTNTGGQVGYGVTEQTWSYLHENIFLLTQTLFETHRDQFSTEETALVQGLLSVMQMKQDLKFVSEKDKPGLFQEAGPHRVAVTGSSPGSTISVNAALTSLFEIKSTDDKFTNTTDLGNPVTTRLRGSAADVSSILQATKKETMANIFGILVHEFGHHLGIKDTPERPLDQIAAKFEALLTNSIQEVDASVINQPWERLRALNVSSPSATAPEGKLYFVEAGELVDLTLEMKRRASKVLNKNVEKIWTYNLRLEGAGTFDHTRFSTPIAFLADVVTLTSDGVLTTVPVRLVSYIGPSQPARFINDPPNWWRFTNGQVRKDSGYAPLSIEFRMDRAQLGVAIRPDPKFDIVSALFPRKEYRAGEVAELHIELPTVADLDAQTLKVELTSSEFVQSGALKKFSFLLAPVRLQSLLNGNTLATFQWQIPGNVQRELNMKVDRISAKAGANSVNFRSEKPIGFYIPGKKSTAKLVSYGNGFRSVLGTIRTHPAPWLGFRTPAGTAIPLEYHFTSGAPLSLRITGTVDLVGKQFSDNAGFVIDLLATENHPLVESKQIIRQGDNVTVKLMLRIPKVFNGKPVEDIFLHSVYLLDQKLDEVFENAEIGIKPE